MKFGSRLAANVVQAWAHEYLVTLTFFPCRCASTSSPSVVTVLQDYKRLKNAVKALPVGDVRDCSAQQPLLVELQSVFNEELMKVSAFYTQTLNELEISFELLLGAHEHDPESKLAAEHRRLADKDRRRECIELYRHVRAFCLLQRSALRRCCRYSFSRGSPH